MSLNKNSDSNNPPKLPEDLKVPAPGPVSKMPDSATSQDPCYTDGHAPNQVFHFQRWGFSYGTDDKGHAAALTLSFAILLLILVIVGIGAFLTDRGFIAEILKVLGSAFLIVCGIAVGKSTEKSE